MSKILFIDQASNNVGLTIVDVSSGKPKWVLASLVKMKGKDPITRTAQLYHKAKELIEEYGITILVLEEVPLMRKTNINTTAVLLKVSAIMEFLGLEHCERVDIMNVLRWKNLAGIKTSTREAQKMNSISLAMNRWPDYKELIANSDDIADVLNMSLAWLIENEFINKK